MSYYGEQMEHQPATEQLTPKNWVIRPVNVTSTSGELNELHLLT